MPFPHKFIVVFLLTFSCYGTHLPGDPRGSFDHVRKGERRFLAPNKGLQEFHRKRMTEEKFVLSTAEAGRAVRAAIIETCAFRCWSPLAVHVRTEHVHGVVAADCFAFQILNAWKAYSTRSLRFAGLAASDRRTWTHGGIAREIQTGGVTAAARYVVDMQGDPMEVWVGDESPLEG
jgi:REP element-mobilizing transposase RayT